MRKLFNDFFYIPKHGKVRDKVILSRGVVLITIVIMCLFAMSFTAYAYFSCDVISKSNIIKSATFDTDVSINDGSVTLSKTGKLQTVDLTNGIYTIKITKSENSHAKTGFCKIKIGDIQYTTSQIGVDVKRNIADDALSFTLIVSSDTRMEILSNWGTSSYYAYNEEDNDLYIKNGRQIDLSNIKNDVEEVLSTSNEINDEPDIKNEDTSSNESTSTTSSSEIMQTSEPADLTDSGSSNISSDSENANSEITEASNITESSYNENSAKT